MIGMLSSKTLIVRYVVTYEIENKVRSFFVERITGPARFRFSGLFVDAAKYGTRTQAITMAKKIQSAIVSSKVEARIHVRRVEL